MKIWPASLRGRVMFALAVAVVAIVVLDLAVDAVDAKKEAPKRVRPVDSPATTTVPAPTPPSRAVVGLRATAGTIAVARRLSALSPDIAPVVEILADGQVVLRRPEPLADQPFAEPPLSRAGHGAAVILPDADLLRLDPAARAALISLLRRWITERPVDPQRLRPIDLRLSEAAMRRLLSWIP